MEPVALVETGMGRARDNELRPLVISKLQAGVMFVVKASDGTAKVSVIRLTQSVAVELAPHHIRVNAIAPGYIESPPAS